LVNNGERDISYASPVPIIIKVNVIALTPSASISASVILGFPTNVQKIPCGTPALSNVFSISIPQCIVELAGFKTTVFPTINKGTANLNTCQ
jgi:hypothetical protein